MRGGFSLRPVWFAGRRRGQRLTTVEREEITRGLAAGGSARRIAVRLGHSPSTISREIVDGGGTPTVVPLRPITGRISERVGRDRSDW
nr:helix-turn-helix domain-containing protein [Nocardia sp. NRRL WC-3656]